MARPKRRQVQVGDTIILRNGSVPDHPTLPVWIGGQQTVIPAGLVGQVVEELARYDGMHPLISIDGAHLLED